MSLRKSAISGMVWTFTQQFGSQGITFVIQTVLARILEPEEFGLIGMIAVFMAIASSLVNSGLTQSLIRTPKPGQADYSTVFYFNLAMSIVIYIILYFTAPFIAAFYEQPVLVSILRVYGLSFIFNAFSTVQLTRLTKAMNFKTQLIVALPSLILSGVIGIVLAYLDFGVWSLVWMAVSQSILSSIQIWYWAKWAPSLIFSKEKFREHFGFGVNLAFSGLINTVFSNIGQIVIGKFFLPSQVGFYTRANALKQLPVSNISQALNKVTYPLFSKINNDDARLKRVYRQIMQMVIYVIAPVLVIMGVLAEPLFRFLFTEKWLPAVPYFQILCILGVFYPLHSYNLSILKVKGRSDLFLKLEIVKRINSIIAIIIGVQFGIFGFLWSLVYTTFAAFFVNSYYTGKFINYPALQQLRDILPIIVLAVLMGTCVLCLDHYIIGARMYDIARLAIGGALGACLYIGISEILNVGSYKDIKNIILKR